MYLFLTLFLFSCLESEKPTPQEKQEKISPSSKASEKQPAKKAPKVPKTKTKASTKPGYSGSCETLMVEYEKEVDSFMKVMIPAIKDQKPTADHLEQVKKLQQLNMEFANKKKELAKAGKFTLDCSKKNNEIMLKIANKGSAAVGKPIDKATLEKSKKSMNAMAELQDCMKNCKSNSEVKAMTKCMRSCGQKAKEQAKQ